MKIVFVCLGNICRSPMAEAMFRQMVEKAGLSNRIEITSAGTSSEEEGNGPHRGTLNELAKHDIPADGLISRPICKGDYESANYIVCMDDSNLQYLQEHAPKEDEYKIYQVYDVVPGKKGQEIPDPWYTHNFDATYESLKEALPFWLELLKSRVSTESAQQEKQED